MAAVIDKLGPECTIYPAHLFLCTSVDHLAEVTVITNELIIELARFKDRHSHLTLSLYTFGSKPYSVLSGLIRHQLTKQFIRAICKIE